MRREYKENGTLGELKNSKVARKHGSPPLVYLTHLGVGGKFIARKVEISRKLQQRAEQMIPGGVNSPVRAFRAVGGDPPFIVRGQGSRVWDADDNEYLDYIGSWGPLILGHADPAVVEVISRAAHDGVTFGASTPAEADLAEVVLSAFPHMQKVRFVSSGTEATMSAIRLARGFTGRDNNCAWVWASYWTVFEAERFRPSSFRAPSVDCCLWARKK